jgi:hypothetical protein
VGQPDEAISTLWSAPGAQQLQLVSTATAVAIYSRVAHTYHFFFVILRSSFIAPVIILC